MLETKADYIISRSLKKIIYLTCPIKRKR